jgi:NAD(P)-dependent dehydrogenase (short-subunit alcohol dehydrogenase family)
MIIGATGSIGSVCSRLLAQAIYDVVLVSIEPEKLIELKRTIQEETPGAKVTIATRAGELIGDCDLIVTATSAFGQRIVDITKCKPGAVICDVARPPDINKAEAALRPDVLVIESGEVLIPGDIDFGYNIGLPPKTAYACLAETALLAMDGRFEDYTLGRNITIERVKEIYTCSLKHGFKLAGCARLTSTSARPRFVAAGPCAGRCNIAPTPTATLLPPVHGTGGSFAVSPLPATNPQHGQILHILVHVVALVGFDATSARRRSARR